MVPKGGLEPPRVTSHAPQTCASTSSATSARPGRISRLNACSGHFLTGAFDGCLSIVDVGIATGAAGVGVAVAAGVGTGTCSGTPDCNTELVPVIAGSDSSKANNMNPTAAPIVIFDNSV
jgi:hypothetical protein